MNHLQPGQASAAVRLGWRRLAWALLAIPLVAAGCGSRQPANAAPDMPTAATVQSGNAATGTEKVDVSTGPFTQTILYTLKDQMPFVLMDLAPELPKLKRYGHEGREEYLLKRALAVLVSDRVRKRKEYEGKDAFVIRMILLMELDEYGKPKWGNAPEIALLEIARDGVSSLTLDAVAALDLDAARKIFRTCRLSPANIDRVAGK